MKTMNLKQKIQDHRVEIAVGVSAFIGTAVVVTLAKLALQERAYDCDLMVVQIIAETSTGEPKHILTDKFGAFDLIPHVE